MTMNVGERSDLPSGRWLLKRHSLLHFAQESHLIPSQILTKRCHTSSPLLTIMRSWLLAERCAFVISPSGALPSMLNNFLVSTLFLHEHRDKRQQTKSVNGLHREGSSKWTIWQIVPYKLTVRNGYSEERNGVLTRSSPLAGPAERGSTCEPRGV